MEFLVTFGVPEGSPLLAANALVDLTCATAVSIRLVAVGAIVREAAIVGAILPADWADSRVALLTVGVAESSILLLVVIAAGEGLTGSASIGFLPARVAHVGVMEVVVVVMDGRAIVVLLSVRQWFLRVVREVRHVLLIVVVVVVLVGHWVFVHAMQTAMVARIVIEVLRVVMSLIVAIMVIVVLVMLVVVVFLVVVHHVVFIVVLRVVVQIVMIDVMVIVVVLVQVLDVVAVVVHIVMIHVVIVVVHIMVLILVMMQVQVLYVVGVVVIVVMHVVVIVVMHVVMYFVVDINHSSVLLLFSLGSLLGSSLRVGIVVMTCAIGVVSINVVSVTMSLWIVSDMATLVSVSVLP